MVTNFLAYFGFWLFIFVSGIIFGYIQALETRNKIDEQLRKYREKPQWMTTPKQP